MGNGSTFADFLSRFMSEGSAEVISWVIGLLVVGCLVYAVYTKRKNGRWPWQKEKK